MADDKISNNEAIDAALHLDGDPETISAFYRDWAENYNIDTASSDYTGPKIAARLFESHVPDKTMSILDAGCGTGFVGIELAALGYRLIDGFDLSEPMAQQAIATGAYETVLGDIDMMKAGEHYAAASYDAVLSVGVFTLGHVPPEALDVLLALTRPGGILLVSTRTHYYEDTDFQQVVDRLVADSAASLLQVLKDAPYNNGGDAHYWVLKKTS